MLEEALVLAQVQLGSPPGLLVPVGRHRLLHAGRIPLLVEDPGLLPSICFKPPGFLSLDRPPLKIKAQQGKITT